MKKVNSLSDLPWCWSSYVCGQLGDSRESEVKENWWRLKKKKISPTWQITPQRPLIFRETHTQKLISFSPFNETASHDSCLPICRNLISIFPRAESCGDTFLIKFPLTTLSVRLIQRRDQLTNDKSTPALSRTCSHVVHLRANRPHVEQLHTWAENPSLYYYPI